MADQSYEAAQYEQENTNGNYGHQGDALDDSDDDEDQRKLFVGGLSSDTTDEDLRNHFGSFGEIQHSIVKYDKASGVSRGFGFVTFAKCEDMKKTLDLGEHTLKNKKIDPKAAQPTKEVQKKVFVGGVNPEVTEDQIRDHFKQFGRIEKVDMPFDNAKGQRKPFVFISFHSEKGAKRAIGEEKQMLGGKQCDVRYAVVKQQQRQSYGGGGGYNQYGGGDGYYGQQQWDYSAYQAPYQQYDPNYQMQGYGGYQGYAQYQGGYQQNTQGGYQQQQQGGHQNNSRGGGKVRGNAQGGRGGGGYHPYGRQQQQQPPQQ